MFFKIPITTATQHVDWSGIWFIQVLDGRICLIFGYIASTFMRCLNFSTSLSCFYRELVPSSLHSHQRWNMFKSCLVKHSLNLFSSEKQLTILLLIANFVQTCSSSFEHCVKACVPVSVTVFHFVKPTILVHFKNIFSWCEWGKLNSSSPP